MADDIDLSGVWMDEGFPTRIEQTGSLLTARWLYVAYECDAGTGAAPLPTTFNFDCSVSGNYISGQTTTCFTSGLKLSSFELTISDDGNTLSGRWWSDDPPQDEPMRLTRCPNWVEPEDLERDDNGRWKKLGLTEVSWYWPASFYMTIDTNGAAKFQGTAYNLTDSNWITASGYFHQVEAADMVKGDVVIFRGKEPEGKVDSSGDIVFREKNPAPKFVSHSAIATGRGDEVSQLWWTREVRRIMKRQKGLVLQPLQAAPGPQTGGYDVTRDSIRDLIQEFTDEDGDQYLVAQYEVWRRRDLDVPNFDGLGTGACDRWPVRHLVHPSRGGAWFSP